MKKIKNSLLFFISFALLISCSDLREDNRGTNFFDSLEPDIIMRGVYEQLRGDRVFEATGYSNQWGDVGADQVSISNNNPDAIRTNNLRTNDNNALLAWRDHIRAIVTVNRGIEFLKTSPDLMSEIVEEREEAESFIAQARFVRAVLYFNMVKLFERPVIIREGDVLAQDINDVDLSLKTNGTATEAYKFIEEDLLFAIDGLENGQVGTAGIASKQAAQGTLAKVYLTIAGFIKNDVIIPTNDEPPFSFSDAQGNDMTAEQLYAKSSALLDEVIDSGIYTLMENYGDIFDPRADAINTEMIFKVNFISGGVRLGSRYSDFVGASGGPPNGGGGARSLQYEYILSYFHTNEEILKYALAPGLNPSFSQPRGYAGLRNGDRGTEIDAATGERVLGRLNQRFNPVNFSNVFSLRYPLPISDTRFLVNVSLHNVGDVNVSDDVSDIRRNQRIDGMKQYKWRKVLPQSSVDTDNRDFDFPYLRLADVFLMKAEAILGEGGSLSEAAELVNKVRRRAFGVDIGTAGQVTTGDVSKLNIDPNLHNTADIGPFGLRFVNGFPQIVLARPVEDGDAEGLFIPEITRQDIATNTIDTDAITNANDPIFQNLTRENSVIRLGGREALLRGKTIFPIPGIPIDLSIEETSDEISLLSAILRERRKELAHEGTRRDDLIRNGALEEVLSGRGSLPTTAFSARNLQYQVRVPPPPGTPNAAEMFRTEEAVFIVNAQNTRGSQPGQDFQPHMYRFPIPETEIQFNPNLIQNSGY